MASPSRGVLVTLLLALPVAGCAGFQPPPAFEPADVHERAVVQERDGARAAAALLTREEMLATFGFDLEARRVQPVWLEIENRTDQPIYFLVTATDREYFAPLELAHLFHRKFSPESNARIDEHVSRLAFDNREAIAPGENRAGFVFTNTVEGTKVVDVDLVGDAWSTSLTLFVPAPGEAEDASRRALIESRFSRSELIELADESALRSALEDLPCCVQDATAAHVAPLNLVVIGDLDRWVSAFQRRGYRYSEVPPLYAFQRRQDAAGRRLARWVEGQPHVIRFWQTPLRFRSLPVWQAHVGTPRGGRFARDPDSLEPRADGARNDAVEDLLYCQNLARMGFVRGAGCPASAASTDGLRVALVFEERTIALDEITFFEWERLVPRGSDSKSP